MYDTRNDSPSVKLQFDKIILLPPPLLLLMLESVLFNENLTLKLQSRDVSVLSTTLIYSLNKWGYKFW